MTRFACLPFIFFYKKRAKQAEGAARKQGKRESREFVASQGRKNHSAVSPAPEKGMEKAD